MGLIVRLARVLLSGIFISGGIDVMRNPGPRAVIATPFLERVRPLAPALEASLEDPVVVGHSASAGTASVYAMQHRIRGVVAVEGTLRVGAFAGMAQSLETGRRHRRLTRPETQAVTRRRLLDAAADVFGEKGFRAASSRPPARRGERI